MPQTFQSSALHQKAIQCANNPNQFDFKPLLSEEKLLTCGYQIPEDT